MTLCLVTDRVRLGPSRSLVDLMKAAVDAGIDLIQIRERDLEAGALASLVAEAVALSRGSATRILVNDRVDVALACGADGVHLRGDSMPIAAARRLLPEPRLVGRSVHTVDEARASAGADYLIAGTVFPTMSKDVAAPTIGVEGLRRIVQAAATPVLAIGGVTPERLEAIAATGAAGVAAIDFFTATPLSEVVRRARQRFDAVKIG